MGRARLGEQSGSEILNGLVLEMPRAKKRERERKVSFWIETYEVFWCHDGCMDSGNN